MRVEISRSLLVSNLQKIINIVNPKANLPVLSNVLIEGVKDKIIFTVTDLDIGITCEIPVNVGEIGAITIPAKRFTDIIRELPEGIVLITVKRNNMVNIESQDIRFKFMGLPKEEYPKLPEFKNKYGFKLDSGILKEMINLTHFAVSNDETKYVLNGILLNISNNKISLVATDGRRLALIERQANLDITEEASVIIPLKAIQELNRNLPEEKEITISIGENQILFNMGEITIVSRLIEGEFPDYRQVIPEISNNKIKVGRESFMMAIRRAALFSTPDYQAVKFEIIKNKLIVSKATPGLGESREEVAAEYNGKDIALGFNPAFLLDVLKNLNVVDVCFEISAADKPAVIRQDGYVYLVLPMRLS